jgi:hypothetical protein
MGVKVTSLYDNTVTANNINTITFNGEGLGDGIYLLVLRSEKFSKVVRVIHSRQ